MTVLTFVTVCFNDRNSLLETIQSLQRLSKIFSDFDHVVIDGGSSDDSVEILNSHEYFNADRILVSEPDNGLYDAMNKGLKLARGRYVCFLNAGDLVNTRNFDWIRLGQLMAKSESILCCNYILRFSNGQKKFKSARKFYSYYPGMPTSHQAMFFPSGISKTKEYRVDYEICSDFDFFCQVQRKVGCDYIGAGAAVIFNTGGKSSKRPFRLIRESMGTFGRYSTLRILYPIKFLQLLVSITMRRLELY
jgi:putative colanic acid biosynthesis glycosyltransferase